MSSIKEQLLNLIYNDVPLTSIIKELNISYEELYKILNLLKGEGLNFGRIYYYDGSIKLIQDLKQLNKTYINLITNKNVNKVNLMLISDIHFGHKKENINALYEIYEYCLKNNINIIINAGDFIDSPNGGMFDNYNDLIEYALNTHPMDDSIVNFICLGNHDYDSLTNAKIDLQKEIIKSRYDIVPLDYVHGVLKIKNNDILICHPFNKQSIPNSPKYLITLVGHSHILRANQSNNGIKINIPTISNIGGGNGYLGIPAAIKLTLTFEPNNKISYVCLDHLVFTNKLYLANQMQFKVEEQLIKKRKNG